MRKPPQRPTRNQLTPGEQILPQHAAFIQGIALEGLSATASYRKYVAEPGAKVATMWSRSCELAGKFKERIEALRLTVNDFLKDKLQWTAETAAMYLVENLETPVGEVDENHRQAQEVRDTEQGRTVKMMSKAEALKQLVQMAGWNKAAELKLAPSDELLEFLREIRTPGIPRIPEDSDELPSLPPTDQNDPLRSGDG